MRFKQFLIESREAPNRGIWYHGDSNSRKHYRDQRMERDLTQQEGNDEGPGIYFTRSLKEAIGYAEGNGYIQTVRVKSDKFYTDDYKPSKKDKYRMLENLIEWAPEERREIGLSNWDEDPVVAKKDALGQYMKWGFQNATLGIYNDFYGSADANEWTGSMVANDIDGYWKYLDDREHLIVYDPKVVEIEDEMTFDEAKERYDNEI